MCPITTAVTEYCVFLIQYFVICDPIRVDLFTMRHEEYGRCFHRRREASSGNLFAAPFLRKIEISHTPLDTNRLFVKAIFMHSIPWIRCKILFCLIIAFVF